MPAHTAPIHFPVEPRGGRKQSLSTKFFLGSESDYPKKMVQIQELQGGKKLRFEGCDLDSTGPHDFKHGQSSRNRRGSIFMRRRSSLTALLATPPPGMKWMSLEVWKCIKWLVAWTLYCIIGALIFITLEVTEKDVEVPHRHWNRFKELLSKQEEREEMLDLRENLIKMCDHTFLNQSFSFELSDVDGLPVWRDWDKDPKENMTEINNEEESLFADLQDVETACRESLFVVRRITSYDTAPSLIDAMYYTMTAITTIGYGHICPSTTANKIFCVLYCLIGVPLTCIFLNNSAEFLSIKMLQTYKRAVKFHSGKKESLLYLITAFFLTIGFIVFMFIPSIALMFIEDWTYLDSFYFTFITLSTIGFGDFVAGYGENHESGWGTVYKLILIMWIVISLGYWVLVLKFVTKAVKKTTKKFTKTFSTRVVTDQATFFRHLVKKVKNLNDVTSSQHNMMDLMNEVEGTLSGKDNDGQSYRSRSVSQSARGARISRAFCNGNVKQFLSESENVEAQGSTVGPERHNKPPAGAEREGVWNTPRKLLNRAMSQFRDTDNTSGFTSMSYNTEATEDEEQDLDLPLSLKELLGVNVVVRSDNVNVMKNIITQVAEEDEGLPQTDKTPEEVTLPLRDALNLVILISTIEDQMNNSESMDERSTQSPTESTWSVLAKDNPRDSLPLLKDMFLNGRPRLHQLRE